jgi:hypothetical protein
VEKLEQLALTTGVRPTVDRILRTSSGRPWRVSNCDVS